MNVLVVAAHPDDEVLGCGAAMASHALKGDRVHVLILAEGLTSRDEKRDRSGRKKSLARLSGAALKAHAILGVKETRLDAFPDNRMDTVPLLEVAKAVEACIEIWKPRIIYTHHGGDLNVDHRIVNQAVLTAARPQPGSGIESVLCFEVPSSTEWQSPEFAPFYSPDWFVDASKTLSLKLKALQAYASEMRPWPHPRSLRAVEHLARWRGSTAGMEAAEAFSLARHRVF